jgi:hypothetical protein
MREHMAAIVFRGKQRFDFPGCSGRMVIHAAAQPRG